MQMIKSHKCGPTHEQMALKPLMYDKFVHILTLTYFTILKKTTNFQTFSGIRTANCLESTVMLQQTDGK